MTFYDRLTQRLLRGPVESTLTAAIGMMEQPLRRAPARQGHPERVEREVVRDALVHRPADGEARTEIEDHRQVEPTLARRNVGDVGDPRLVRPSTLELPRQDVGGDGKRMPRLRVSGHPMGLGPREAPMAERLVVDAMGRRLPGASISPGARCDGPTSTSACWPTVLPSGIVALRGRLTHGPRSPAARRA